MNDGSNGGKLDYLDLQALIGVSKHNGGSEATDALLDMCHVAGPLDVLYVGSGVGVGPVRIAGRRGCRVVAVDVDPRMIHWSRVRVDKAELASRIRLGVADIRSLPHPDGTFDAVIIESVFGFLEDKAAALAECVRVTKPGGWVGANEACWLTRPPLSVAREARALGTVVPLCEGWPRLWEASGLEETAMDFRRLEPGEEVKSRFDWLGWPWILSAWARALRLAVRRPAVRASLKEQLAPAGTLMHAMGYYLMAGRKPA